MDEKNWEKLVLGGISDIIMVTDQFGSIVYINHVIPGFTLEKVLGTSVNNYVPPAYHEAYLEALKNVFEKGDSKEFVVAGAGPNNTTAWYLTRIGPIKENDQVIAAAIISTDITLRMESNEDLKAAKQEVDRLTREVNELQNKPS